MQFFNYLGNTSSYQVFNINQNLNEGNLLYILLKDENDGASPIAEAEIMVLFETV